MSPNVLFVSIDDINEWIAPFIAPSNDSARGKAVISPRARPPTPAPSTTPALRLPVCPQRIPGLPITDPLADCAHRLPVALSSLPA